MSRITSYDGILRNYFESVRDYYKDLTHVNLLLYRRVDKADYISVLLAALQNPLPILLDVADDNQTVSIEARKNLGVVLEAIVEQNKTFDLRLTDDMNSFLLLSSKFRDSCIEDKLQELKKIMPIISF